jgi:hypothetical protein
MQKRFAVLVAAAMLANFAGCGAGGPPTTTPVSGVVTFDGQPLTGGTITFISMAESGKGVVSRPAVGVLGAEGKYTLSTFAPGDGAIPGDYQVVVVSDEGVPSPEEFAEKNAKVKSAIPAGYNSPTTSGLRAKVEGSSPLVLNFDLKTGAVPDAAPAQGNAPDPFGI